MSNTAKTCGDCQCDLVAIRLLDRWNGFSREPEYAHARDQGALIPTPIGTLKGWMCPQCHRVQLYAEPRTAHRPNQGREEPS